MSRAGVLATCILCSCGPDQPRDVLTHFTVRGRWPDPSHLSYHIETGSGPLGESAWVSAIERALRTWSGTGVVGFEEAAADRPADVTLAWRRGAHEECEPFGISSAVAHSGPVASGTFIHLDADRTWDDDLVYRAVLHEVGHVLGLGHSAEPASLMTPEGGGERITESELAGLHSLYGGGTDGDGDLRILSAERTAVVLRRVAPPDITDCALFDSDGDGDDEVLVWRTDPEGNGALMIYHFEDGPLLSHTVGPWYGVTVPGAPVHLLRRPDDQRLLVSVRRDGALLVLGFDDAGSLLPLPVPEGLRAEVEGQDHRRTGDLDGNGTLETIVSSPPA